VGTGETDEGGALGTDDGGVVEAGVDEGTFPDEAVFSGCSAGC